MKAPVRFGMASFAHHHANHWARAIRRSDTAELVGVWDDDSARGRAASDHYESDYYADLAQLLDRCDAVGITAETTRHAELVEQAAEAGVHILCEKPMAGGMDDCDRILSAVQRSGVRYMQNFPKRFDPINAELADIVNAGVLGEITLARIRHSNFHFLEVRDRQWFTDQSQAGGGILLDEGIHGADLVLWLFGEPDRVAAAATGSVLGLGVEDTALVVYSYSSGLLVELATGGGLLAADSAVEIHGTEGSVTVSGTDLTSREFAAAPFLKVHTRANKRGEWQDSTTVPRFRQDDFHETGPLHFVECLLEEREPVTGLQEGVRSVCMILAAYEAAANGLAQSIHYPALEQTQIGTRS